MRGLGSGLVSKSVGQFRDCPIRGCSFITLESNNVKCCSIVLLNTVCCTMGCTFNSLGNARNPSQLSRAGIGLHGLAKHGVVNIRIWLN